MKTALALAASIIALAFSPASFAEHVIDISGVGTQKFSVQIGVGNQAFAKCLARNLELSGLFKVGGGGSIRVSGGPGALRAEGGGKVVWGEVAGEVAAAAAGDGELGAGHGETVGEDDARGGAEALEGEGGGKSGGAGADDEEVEGGCHSPRARSRARMA